MASWKGLYRNVSLGLEDPKAPERRSQPGTKEYPEEESVYEPFDAVTGLEGKQAGQVAAPWHPAGKPSWTRKVVLVAIVALLATSVFLNVLLLAVGIMRFPSSFLLYNENRSHCVTRKEPSSLTKAPCDPGDWLQHFRWFSSGLLLHVDSLLCVATPKAKRKENLRLEPCNRTNPLQRWECRDHDLLALEGKDLYFNYGNSPDRVVMLYDGNGPWSRWLTYSTRKNICSNAPLVSLPSAPPVQTALGTTGHGGHPVA
ncbi:macrophage mannose receptor 1-like isoform X2 [Lacerta agilis]|uniref:macrophage mannose receptor 1-like isoform X2 n=1 Tax=Lacerta agilis TaxID=80427 RepID=UPI001419EFD1|nr:macrophage mannose receptor 1-like isoform X2 [Lacerta agilis]